MKAPRDERQLELFSDDRREWTLKVIEALEEHSEVINRMYDLSQKVLLGVPGYARPEYIKRLRAHRNSLSVLIGYVAVKPNVRRQFFKAKPPRPIGTATGTALPLKI